MTYGSIPTDEDGNYDSPVLSKLDETWNCYDAGEIEDEEVLDVLERVENLTLQQLRNMEGAESDPNVDVCDPNRVAILKAFRDHLKAMDLMRDFFFTDDPRLVDDGFEILQKATNRMMLGFQGLLSVEQAPPKACLRCCALNPRAAKFCTDCQAAFPVVELNESPSLVDVEETFEAQPTTPTTPNFLEVLDAFEAWNYEEISSEEFLRVCKRILRRHRAEHQELLRAIERPPANLTPDYLQSRAVVIERNVDAMEALIRALESGDDAGVGYVMDELEEATAAICQLAAA